MENALKIWEEEGLPQLRLREPWHGYNLGDWTKEDEEMAELAVRGDFAEIERRLAEKAVKIKPSGE
jgi:4-hydroxy-3-polyprenylbenzoate decarboxylase